MYVYLLPLPHVSFAAKADEDDDLVLMEDQEEEEMPEQISPNTGRKRPADSNDEDSIIKRKKQELAGGDSGHSDHVIEIL